MISFIPLWASSTVLQHTSYEHLSLAALLTSAVMLIMSTALFVAQVIYFRTLNRKYNYIFKMIEHHFAQMFSGKRTNLSDVYERISGHSTMTDEEESDYAEWARIDIAVRKDKLFLRPRLTRDDVCEHVGVSRQRFKELFERFSVITFTKYINEMRLAYGASLLVEHPQYTVEAIAQECGIPVRQTFYRLFVDRYGVTPMAYREAMGVMAARGRSTYEAEGPESSAGA